MTDQGAYPKRLIEVDLPIRRISAHARREKSIRHGHISTLHIWWARRPLAACRAVICAALWPDPGDPQCPKTFLKNAREHMLAWAPHERQKLLSEESRKRFEKARKNPALFDDVRQLRGALLDFIADFANWDNSTVSEYLDTCRALTQSAHEALGGTPGTRPLLIDPFAGGGSIPLEALRVGADAFASDLNPVAVLLNKVVLEYLPKYGQRLADEVRKWGEWTKREAEKELGEVYPKDADGATPIAYLWARTIQCEGPACGAEVPILPSRLLEKNGDRSTWIGLHGKGKSVAITIERGTIGKLDLSGTAKRGSVTCPRCGYTTPVPRVREQMKLNGGGVKQARLLAVVTHSKAGVRGYRLPNQADYKALAKAAEKIVQIRKTNPNAIPDETLPLMSGVFNVPLYGHTTWASLYSDRQLLLLLTLCRLVKKVGEKIASDKDDGLAAATATMLSIAIGKVADYSTSICTWVQSGGFVGHTFAQGQCLPMKFDFAESVPLAGFSGSWEGAIDWGCRIIERDASAIHEPGHVESATATAQSLPDDAASCLVTDPPYYNAVPYADLSDFFYVWHRRTLGHLHEDLFRQKESPKAAEICEMAGWDPARYANKTAGFFESEIGKAFADSRRVVRPDGIGVIVFAHKTTSGWESLLQAIVDSGWVVTASWPVDTERASRLRAMKSAALASSVHLVCRPRENSDGSVRSDEIGDWRDVLQQLPVRIHEWMPRLADEGVVGADAIFACLGPALEIFSRYSRVEKASGETVSLKEYLEQVWAAVSKEALAMIFTGADATGFEEDARLTAMWLWTLSTAAPNGNGASTDEDGPAEDEEVESSGKGKSGGFLLEYDAARKIAQGLGAHLEALSTLVEVKGSTARLLPVAERTRSLFHRGEAATLGGRSKSKKKTGQLSLGFVADLEEAEESGGWGGAGAPQRGESVLDRVHQSMILFGAGRGEALKRFLVEDGVGRDDRFWRLAQAFSALYPASTDEKRWVDGVLARKKGLGF
jgi:adenine-specific DNA methylase